jgi:hypothetical protein
VKGKRLIDVVAESQDLRDKFLCIKGDLLGSVAYWDEDNDNALTIDDLEVTLTYNMGLNEWILVKEY